MYTPIEGMLPPNEAADALVFHATKISDAIKQNDNCLFPHRLASINAILKLLAKYVEQPQICPENSSLEIIASTKNQFFLEGSLNHKMTDERILEIADQCSSWFTPAGSKTKERMLDHFAFARSIISELDP